MSRSSLALLVALSLGVDVARAQTVIEPDNFTFGDPAVTVEYVYTTSGPPAEPDAGEIPALPGFTTREFMLSDGTVLLVDGQESAVWRISPTGAITCVAYVNFTAPADFRLAVFSPADGTLMMFFPAGMDGEGLQQFEVWRLRGLPRTNAGTTGPGPGDLVPGLTNPSTTPPTFTPVGDGVVDIADVVVVLRASVGLVQFP